MARRKWSIVRGKEKFWAVLVAGWTAPVTVLTLWIVAVKTQAFPPPGPDEIRAAVAIFVATPLGAFGAYIATNTQTEDTRLGQPLEPAKPPRPREIEDLPRPAEVLRPNKPVLSTDVETDRSV